MVISKHVSYDIIKHLSDVIKDYKRSANRNILSFTNHGSVDFDIL